MTWGAFVPSLCPSPHPPRSKPLVWGGLLDYGLDTMVRGLLLLEDEPRSSPGFARSTDVAQLFA